MGLTVTIGKIKQRADLETSIAHELTEIHGPLIGSRSLWKVLGFSSSDAYRQALSRKSLPIPIFKIENRKGNFALVQDVARWLVQVRMTASEPKQK